MSFISRAYRFLPPFNGKRRIGAILFRKAMFNYSDSVIRCRKGLKFHLLNTHDSVGRELFFEGEYEPNTIHTIQSLLQPDDVVVDAGANIGAISLPVAKGNEVTVYAFEPGREIFQALLKNLDINNLTNVLPVNMALSDKSGRIDFYESHRVHGWSGPVKIDGFDHYKVQAVTLDAFATEKRIKKIGVLKADVQGWEYYVFKGAERLIDEGRIANIVFEFEWWAEQNAGLEIGTAQRFLMDKGYSIRTLEGEEIETPLRQGSLVLHASLEK